MLQNAAARLRRNDLRDHMTAILREVIPDFRISGRCHQVISEDSKLETTVLETSVPDDFTSSFQRKNIKSFLV